MSTKLMSLKTNVIKLNVIKFYRCHQWKELAEKRRLDEQYYKGKDKAIKDYKFRRGVKSDFNERVAKPVTEKIGEQIKKTGRTGRKDIANAGASIAWTTNTSTACTQNEAHRIHGRPR